MEHEDLLNVATEAGSLLLCSGAEMYRVEESMRRIFEAYGVRDSNIFAIPSCIYVTINAPGGAPITRVKRILDALIDGTLNDGGALAQNHLYMATMTDHYITAGGSTVKVLVRGGYSLS